jgi:PAS domain S-box-containing protein
MIVEQENTAVTIKRLQGCISDLISVLALPALWTGNEPAQIINTLLDGLVSMLRLDFAYGKLSGGPPIEVLRLAQHQTPLIPPEKIGYVLNSWLTGNTNGAPISIPNPIGSGEVLIAPLRLGFHDEIGVVVAGSRRRDFPTTIETLLLRVAANQAAIGLQEAWLLRQQKDAAEELEKKVARRTQQLSAVNFELSREILQRERVEEEERKLASLVEHSTDFIGVSSLDGRALFLNAAGQRMIGLEGSAQVTGTSLLDYVVERERDRFEQEVLPLAFRDGRWEGELQLRHFKTGAAIPMLHHMFFINEQGTDRRIALATISRDMTMRKQAEKTLLESERKFSVVFDRAAFAIALNRLPDRLFVDVNAAWSKIFGFKREEVVGRTSLELGMNRDLGERELLFSELEQHGSIRNQEVTFSTKTGAACIVSCNLDVVSFGGNKYLLSTMHDITEHKRSEEERRRAEAYLREGQRLSHTGSWAWNVVTGDLFWSEEHYRIFGLDPGTFKLTLQAAQQFIHPEDLPAALPAFNTAPHERSDFEWNFRIVRPDGEIRYVRSQAYPVFNKDGELSEYVGTIIDTTERKLAEEALRQAQAELAHASRVLTVGELTSSIAHEVNQPLGAIVTNGNASLHFLAREVPDLDGTREAIDCMIGDALRASEVIKRVRTLLKKGPPEKRSLNVNDTIQEVVGLTAGQLATNKVVVRTKLEYCPPVLGDRVQLQQVLLNLILNGSEAMNLPGWEPRELVISSQQAEPGEALVTVRDTGIGLDQKNQERVFDAFFTSKDDGLGLGLSISRTIIEAHGGRLWYTPNEGKGATFQFTLPSDAGG